MHLRFQQVRLKPKHGEGVTVTRFGPAGNSPAFYEEGRKSSREVPAWLAEKGLSAYEYQCGRGVRVGEKLAREIGSEAEKHEIALSIHAPYYINLCSENEETIDKSLKHLVASYKLAFEMGAEKIVFHPGSLGKLSRQAALEKVMIILQVLLEKLKIDKSPEVFFCPETMGKKSQLGSLEEVLKLCSLHPAILPAVDFAHIHAVSQGKLNDRKAFADIINCLEDNLPEDKLEKLHIHFSPIEFGPKGEKRHRSTRDDTYGPRFEYLAEEILYRSLNPTVICESSGYQVYDAIYYRDIFEELRKKMLQRNV